MREYKLVELFDMQMGKTPARNRADFWEGGTNPWISIADMTSNGRFIVKTKECISDKAVYETGIKPIYPGTVIMSFKLSVGKVARTTVKSYSNEAIMAFEIKGSEPSEYTIDNEYAYYLLTSLDFNNVGNKAVMGKTLNKQILENTVVRVHKWETQRKIIAELDKVNNLINLRTQQLLKLEELVKSRFIELFGDPYINDKNWPMKTFGDICTVRQGLQIPISKRLKKYEEDCYEYITVAYLHGSKEREYIKRPKNTVICSKDDILMTRTGNTGMVVTDVEGVFHNNFFLIDFDRTKYSKRFLVEYLNLDLIQTEIINRAGIAIIPDLNHGQFYAISIYEPPFELQEQFSAFVEQTDKSKLAIQQSLEKLETLKKALMQQYFG